MTTTPRSSTRAMLATTMTILAVILGIVATAGPAAAAPRSTAAQVTLVQTGGFGGVHHRYVVNATTAHVDTPTLMRMTSGSRFLCLDASYPAGTPGADRFAYTVTVLYTNGTTKTVDTVDGAAAPAVLWQAIELTRQISLDVAPTPVH